MTIYGVLAIWEGYQTRPQIAMLLALLAFAFYLAALVTARQLSGRRAFAVAIAFGLAFRILLFPEAPFLSDDYFRYLWDGIVQLKGLNPYRFAPSDPALVGIDDALRARVNHPEVRTIYPPLAQLVFLAAAKVSAGSYFTLKAVWLVCDIGIAVLLYRLVAEERRLQAWMLYWWSPLVVIEVYWNAHLDLLGVAFVVVLLALAKQSPIKSHAIGVAVAAASLIKYFAVAFLPAATRTGRSLRVMAAFCSAVALLSVPYTSSGVAHLRPALAVQWRSLPRSRMGPLFVDANQGHGCGGGLARCCQLRSKPLVHRTDCLLGHRHSPGAVAHCSSLVPAVDGTAARRSTEPRLDVPDRFGVPRLLWAWQLPSLGHVA